MANIPSVAPFDAVGSTVITPVTLGASNTLTFNASRKQVLFVRNASASSVTLTLDGADAPATVKVPGTGATFNSATGATIPAAAGATVAIPLANYRAYLVGAVTLDVSAPTDVTAWLIEV
jgi:hypothetical protein